ncbi:unnamed protein product [Caenorhabditis sp. 36 PRJEB53466]|nr:unnamed protein product [Caenorhabditis sp. 36 PRJEB53466]
MSSPTQAASPTAASPDQLADAPPKVEAAEKLPKESVFPIPMSSENAELPIDPPVKTEQTDFVVKTEEQAEQKSSVLDSAEVESAEKISEKVVGETVKDESADVGLEKETDEQSAQPTREPSIGTEPKEAAVTEEPMDVDKSASDEPEAAPKLEPEVEVVDHALELLKKEVSAAINVFQKYYEDLDLANKVSQAHLSSYTRSVILSKMNANTVHIDGYHARIEMAKTKEDFEKLLAEIQLKNHRARQSREINKLLGEPLP